MIPHFLSMFVLFAEKADFISAGKSFQGYFTRWTQIAVRKPLNTAIIEVTYNSVSLIGCARDCTLSSFNFEQDRGRCHCNNALDNIGGDQNLPELIYGVLLSDNKNEAPLDIVYKPDCYAYYTDGVVGDGNYKIQPSRDGPIKDVQCDMRNGGWTIILVLMGNKLATDPTLSMNRSWTDYVKGFDLGDGGLWSGLEIFHQLTKQDSKLRIMVTVMGDNSDPFNTIYSNVTVGDAASNYTLHVSDFDGNCGDSLSSHNGRPFAVPGGDNKCADKCGSGWWYGGDGNCGQAVLTSMQNGDGYMCSVWETCSAWDRNTPVTILTMAVKPV